MFPNENGSEKKRRQKRVRILQRLDDLSDATPVYRTQWMLDEFGPYWYFYILDAGKIPDELKQTERYREWTVRNNPNPQPINPKPRRINNERHDRYASYPVVSRSAEA